MAQIDDYALLAAAVYKTSPANKINVNGWMELTQFTTDSNSGFSAKAYSNGSEIVIAYSGTNQTADWLTGNAAAFSLPTSQVFEAMKFYLDVKAANQGASITFTGHSLGGGLASLMGVFFDKQAVTFDEAPFGLTAINPVLISALEAYLLVNGYTDLAFAEYNASFTTLFWLWESNVSHIYLANDVLVPLRDVIHGIAGSNTRIDMDDSNLTNPVALHSMTLLAAMWLDTDFASLVQQLPNFAVYLRDSNWFGGVENEVQIKADLLANLLNEQYGPQNNNKLNTFVTDLQQLLGTDGTALSNLSVRDALMVSAMEYYYNKVGVSVGQLFDGSSGIDALAGGYGDDLYIVDDSNDTLTEEVGAGQDRVDSSVSFSLSSNIEDLNLLGDAALSGSGNGLNNNLTGNKVVRRVRRPAIRRMPVLQAA